MGLRCDCYQCQNSLQTVDEVKLGVCSGHLELIERKDVFIGICWNCQRITFLGSRRKNDKEIIIKDKYIFSKGCRHCTDETDGINWMTIKDNSLPVTEIPIVGPIEFIKITNTQIDSTIR